jgi:uncharacterized protein (DUF433 family)
MPAVRKALRALQELDLELWTEDGGPRVAVDRAGRVVLDPAGPIPEASNRQTITDVDMIELTHPFPASEALRGPDLLRPRPHLRIVPGKLAGSPHVERTRVETRALAALARRGMGTGKIAYLYPLVEPPAIDDAIDLEKQLAQNLRAAA